MKNIKIKLPYIIMFLFFIPWCITLYDLSFKNLNPWIFISVLLGGLYGWYLILSKVKKYN